MASRLRSLFAAIATAAALALLVLGGKAEGATDPADVEVLQQLLKNVGGIAKLPSWSGNDPCGDRWLYIQCSGSSVTSLQLKQTNLQGELPPNLNQMVNLRGIGLQGNNFTGSLPTLRGLANLQTAYLDYQAFTSIPADFFSGLTSLTLISLDYSSLNDSHGGWSLPSDVADLQQLNMLSLTHTHLSGSLPDFLAALPNLQNVRLAYNFLSGSIPPSYSAASFVNLQLNNQLGTHPLSGSIAAVAGMVYLSQLWLQVNAFSGPIPERLGLLASLQDCRLNDNQLVGPIPSSFGSSSSLVEFAVQHNLLSGPVPKIASLSPQNFTYADENMFCSVVIGAACAPEVTALLDFLGGVGYPAALAGDWGGNNPCTWIGISCDSSSRVITVNLPKRNLSGIISPALANVTHLQTLLLNDNNLTGTIPTSLASLSYLRVVALQNNNLDPPVPRLPGVTLNVEGNPNILAGSPAPSPHGNEGNAPAPVVEQPPSIVEQQPLVSSPPGSAGGSSPTGQSPVGPSNATTAAPSSLIGQVSQSKTGKRASIAVVAGGIAGAMGIALFACMAAFFLVRRKTSNFRSLQSANTVVVHPAGSSDDPDALKLALGSRALDLSESRTESVMSGSDGVQMVEAGNLMISIQVLRNVTNNFSPDNIVGRGGFGVVYKGELDDGTKIAVKRMEACVVSNKGLKEFHSEIAVLTKVRHRHLVSLLGYCIDGSERLLVYEFMQLGPLSQHLFEYAKLGLPPLSLKRRLSIALDVARGMEYLHGLAHQRSFIHRDLKPSNILLGDDYRAKVSDFGLVKLASEEKNSIETRLAGTFGYLAPEYAVTGRVTTKSDVFSFGVVLMELITGRRALDESQPEESVHLVAWFRRTSASSDNFLKAIIDPELDVSMEETLASIKTAAELAGHCTSREAWNRPDMSHAVNVLLPLVEQWKPTDVEGDEGIGIDLDMTLPQALKKWQAFEGASSVSSTTSAYMGSLDDTNGSMPSRPLGFAESFTSNDGR